MSKNQSGKKFPIIVLSDDLQSPDNVGTLFRTCESFGVQQIFLGAKSPSPKIKTIRRISRSTTETIPYLMIEDLCKQLKQLVTEGYRTVAIEITADAIPLQNFNCNSSDKIVFVIGTERSGISEELLSVCSEKVYIPMYGLNHSMNVINALSIVLYHSTNQMQ